MCDAVLLEISQLLFCIGIDIGLTVMLQAKCYHSLGIMMFFFTPGGIEVVVCKIRIAANGTAKPYFTP